MEPSAILAELFDEELTKDESGKCSTDNMSAILVVFNKWYLIILLLPFLIVTTKIVENSWWWKSRSNFKREGEFWKRGVKEVARVLRALIAWKIEIYGKFYSQHHFYIMTVFGSEHNLALAYALAGNLSFAVLQIVFKQSTGVLSSFELLYIRSVFLFAITAWLINKKGLTAYIPSSQSELCPSQPFEWYWFASS